MNTKSQHPLLTARRFISSLVALVFLAQSAAALAAPCLMMDGHAGDLTFSEMDGHAGHTMTVAQSDHGDGGVCCEAGSYCSMANCLAAAALVEIGFQSVAVLLVSGDTPTLSPLIAAAPELLFRPPIPG